MGHQRTLRSSATAGRPLRQLPPSTADPQRPRLGVLALRALAHRAGVPALPAPARHELRGARAAPTQELGAALALDDGLAVGRDVGLRRLLRHLAAELTADLPARLGGDGLGLAGEARVDLVADAVWAGLDRGHVPAEGHHAPGLEWTERIGVDVRGGPL